MLLWTKEKGIEKRLYRSETLLKVTLNLKSEFRKSFTLCLLYSSIIAYFSIKVNITHSKILNLSLSERSEQKMLDF